MIMIMIIFIHLWILVTLLSVELCVLCAACSGINSQQTQRCYFGKAGNLNGQQD